MKHADVGKYNVMNDNKVSIDEGISDFLAPAIKNLVRDRGNREYIFLTYQMAGAKKSALFLQDQLNLHNVPCISTAANVSRRGDIASYPTPDDLNGKLRTGYADFKRDPLFLFWDDYSSSGRSLSITKKTYEEFSKGKLIDFNLDNYSWFSASIGDDGGYVDWSLFNGLDAVNSKMTLDDAPVEKLLGRDNHKFNGGRTSLYDSPTTLLEILAEEIFMDSRIKDAPLMFVTIKPNKDCAQYLSYILNGVHIQSSVKIIDERKSALRLPPTKHNILRFLYVVGDSEDFEYHLPVNKILSKENLVYQQLFTSCVIERNPVDTSVDFAAIKHSE